MRLTARLRYLLLAVFVLCLGESLSAQTTVDIHSIMAAPGTDSCAQSKKDTYFLPDSTYLYSHYGAAVSVSGVVVGVESTGDYAGSVYLSNVSSDWDSCQSTSEGLPVFNVKSVNAACAVIGANITVVGDVVESNTVVPADITAANTPGTGILPTTCTVNSTGNTMTQAISVGGVLTAFGDALKYTGMTTTATFYAVAPSGSTKAAATGAVTSTGQFWATLTSNTSTNNHLFRSVGIAGDEYVPVTGVTTWAGNPQRVLIDTTTFGGSPVDITVGQSISCTTGANIKVGATAGIGLIDYTLGYARLLIFPTSVCTVSGTVQAINSATSDFTHFHVGTLDLNGLGTTDVDYATRLKKAVVAIEINLGQPDIVSLQEIADYATLSALATAINTAAGTKYQPYLYPGANAGVLNLGFLVNTATVTVDSVNQLEANSTYTTTAGATAALWAQPPLVLKAEFLRSIGPSYPITVIDTMFTARTNISDSTLGPDIRNHRAAQAVDMSNLVQSYQSAKVNTIVAGNLNAFEFSDGYVDVTGIIKGAPAASGTVTLYEPTSTTNALTDFVASTATSRYNYIERGDAVMYEHILASNTVLDSNTASTSLAAYETAITQPHFTTDYPAAAYATSTTSAAGLTPHDGLVVAFLIPAAPTTAAVSPTTLNFGNVNLGASNALTATFTNTTTFASTVTVSALALSGTNAANYTQTSNCGTLTMGSSCTITVTFKPTAIGSRTATLTITSDSTSDQTVTLSLIGNGTDTTATLTPTTATFPSTDIGATSAATVFTFTNTSASVVETVGTPTITGDYSITANTCTSSIAVGATCTISVVFSPTVAGSRTGTLTVPNSSTGNPTLTAALGGTGLDTTATLTPATYSFPDTGIGGTSAASVFTVTNTSTIAITISGPAILGDYAIASTTCGGSLAASATCTISVTFSPTAVGARPGTLTVTDTSTGNPTLTASLTGNGLPTTATISPTTFSFPGTDVTGVSAAQVFTVTNTSPNAISIKALTTTITGDFAISATTCTNVTIAANATCTVSVTFNPTVVGARTGMLTVTDNSSANPTLTASLTGTSLDTSATIAATTLTFPATDIGGSSPAQTVTVTNTSTVTITVGKISITGDYAQTATTCGTILAAGATCTVSVDFVPTATGTRTGTLTVANSTTANAALVAQLTGTGLDTTATLTPSSADFGGIYAGGGTSAAKSFTLTNTSAIAITVKGITVTGNFSQTNTCGPTLTAGASCGISVIFAPLTSGALTGTLTVTNNTTANPTLTASLTGTGLPTTATLAPMSLSYGNVIVGQTSAAQNVVWTNTSAIPLTISKASVTGDYSISATTCTGPVAAGASCTVSVVFVPTALYVRTGVVTVASTSSANPTLSASLTGTGVADVEASVTALNFGNVDIGTSGTPQTFTLTNYTAASISLTSIVISGDYAYTTTCGSTVAGLSTCTITVGFTPTAIGTRTGAITVNTNDTKYPVITVTLTGNGVDFAIAVSPTSGSTLAGYIMTPNLTVTPLGGYSAAVALSCTTNATGSTCTPQAANPTLSAAITMPLTITTTSQYTVIGYSGLAANGKPLMVLFALLGAAVLAMRRRLSGALPKLTLACLMLVALGAGTVGCGSQDPNKNANPTYPGTYTYTVTATDGILTHTATYTLSVAIRY